MPALYLEWCKYYACEDLRDLLPSGYDFEDKWWIKKKEATIWSEYGMLSLQKCILQKSLNSTRQDVYILNKSLGLTS